MVKFSINEIICWTRKAKPARNTIMSSDQTMLIEHVHAESSLVSAWKAQTYNVHTPHRKTVTPALRQTGTAINTRNTWCMIFKWDSFDNKQHIVSKPLRLVSAIISLLEQHNTPLLSLHLEVGVTVFLSDVCTQWAEKLL